MVTIQEYENLCKWLGNHHQLRPPVRVINGLLRNYWTFDGHVYLARFLVYDKQYEPAIRLIEAVIDQTPEEDDRLARALNSLGAMHWKCNNNSERALFYFNRSLEVLDYTKQNYKDFENIQYGGRYLANLLEILRLLLNEKSLKELVHSEIYKYTLKYKKAGRNSYIFYANLFLADIEEKADNLELAIEHAMKGLAASEYKDDSLKIFLSYQNKSDEQLYNKLIKLSTSAIVHFDV